MKKGFTLIELLAVIIILSVVSILVFPNVIEIINQSKRNLYNVQVADIELESKNWALENSNKLDKYHLNATYVSLSTLKREGFLEVDDLENPLNGKEMNGCIEIKYNPSTSQYTYKYYDDTCSTYVTDEMHGTIYSYDNGSLEVIEKNVLAPAGKTIIDYYQTNGIMNSIGGTTDGLYDLGDIYVFRGTNPSNYVKIGNELYRVLSIDKDYHMRVMRSTGETNNWSIDTTYTNFLNSEVSTSLIEYLETETNSINSFKDKIVDGTTLYTGSINNSAMGYNVLKSVEATSTISNKIGLINVSDYVIASLDNRCINNVYSGTCNNANYLSSVFGDSNVWTMNPSVENNKAMIIQNKNITSYSVNGTNDITFKVYPVINMNSNTWISSGTGTDLDPYVLN